MFTQRSNLIANIEEMLNGLPKDSSSDKLLKLTRNREVKDDVGLDSRNHCSDSNINNN